MMFPALSLIFLLPPTILADSLHGSLRRTQALAVHSWAENVYLDLTPLSIGFGEAGADILQAALEVFKQTFRDGFTSCVENIPSGNDEPVVVQSMDDPVFSLYPWNNDTVRPEVFPMPFQQPNPDLTGFVQQIRYEVPELVVTMNANVTYFECTRQAFIDGDFAAFVQNAASSAPASSVKDAMFGVNAVNVLEESKFEAEHENRLETREITGTFNLDLGQLSKGYGPVEEAAVREALNGPVIFPLIAEAVRSGVGASIANSRVYSVAHYVFNESDPLAAMSFLPGSYYAADTGTIIVNNGQNPDLVVTGPPPGNMVNQVLRDDGVVTTFDYKFWLQWWYPPQGYEGDIMTEKSVIEGINSNSDAIVTAIKEADTTGYFDPITTAMAEEYSEITNPNPSDVCGFETPIVGCVLDNDQPGLPSTWEDTIDCNDYVPETQEDCSKRVRYTYYVYHGSEPEGSVLIHALRYRDGSYWGNLRAYSENKWEQEVVPNGGYYMIDTWESENVNFCEASEVETRFEFKTNGAGMYECDKAGTYTLVTTDRAPPSPPPTCTLEISLSCTIGTTQTDCGDYNPAASDKPCSAVANYTYVMHNNAPFNSGRDLTFSEIKRTRLRDAVHGDGYDFLANTFDGSLTLMAAFTTTIRELLRINFCTDTKKYVTTFSTVSTPDDGWTICENEDKYTLDLSGNN